MEVKVTDKALNTFLRSFMGQSLQGLQDFRQLLLVMSLLISMIKERGTGEFSHYTRGFH
jgi:hypothetical protein